ncbi:MAG: hypothetical protein IJ545_08535 [Alphaproteobacteria bacterium]|nr:hypothetical protein [Alphaproteobacteria bacterium]
MFHSKTFKLCCLIVIICFAIWKIYIFLEQDRCLDNGNVWDYQDNRCRDDCLTWNRINGCIKLTVEQIKLFKECRYKANNCVPRKVFDEICLNNNLPLNQKTGECDTEFTTDECNKLGEDWIYPVICNKEQ